jgi:hypothetical protein
VYNYIKDYRTKDVKVNTVVNNLKSFYGQIDAIKARATLAAS